MSFPPLPREMDKADALAAVVKEFLAWERRASAPAPRGGDYLNGDWRKGGLLREDGKNGWDDFADICKRARKALRRNA